MQKRTKAVSLVAFLAIAAAACANHSWNAYHGRGRAIILEVASISVSGSHNTQAR